jgi:hypothetical protein
LGYIGKDDGDRNINVKMHKVNIPE